tara:strand:+ start:1958 stop:2725 length:768 start_codon:yes stop_codon:yes gene_type:complete
MLSIIDLKTIAYKRTDPYTRNRQGRLVQEPYFTVCDGGDTFHLRGRLVMWSFLDSLYPSDPLPRGPVEDDLFAPQVDTPSMLSLLTEFAGEAAQHNRYLIMEHENQQVTLVRNLDQYALSTDIERVGRMLESAGFGVEYRPSVYIDSKGSHLRASVFCRIGAHTLRAIDIGSLYYLSVKIVDATGKTYSIIPPTTAKKHSNSVQNALRDILDIASLGVTLEVARNLGAIPAVDESQYLLTRELDTLLHDRLRRCI